MPGYYRVELRGSSQPVRVRPGQRTTIGAGSVVVTGSSNSLYELYDPTGKSKYEFTRIGQSIEILPGYYSIKVSSHWIRDIELSDGQQLELAEPVE